MWKIFGPKLPPNDQKSPKEVKKSTLPFMRQVDRSLFLSTIKDWPTLHLRFWAPLGTDSKVEMGGEITVEKK